MTIDDGKCGDGRLVHVWGVSRTWYGPDGVVCVHPYEKGEPGGYAAWGEWADKQVRKRRKRLPCLTPGCPLERSSRAGAVVESPQP